MAIWEQVLGRFGVSLASKELVDFPSAGNANLVKSPQPLLVHWLRFILLTLAIISTTLFFLPSACQPSSV